MKWPFLISVVVWYDVLHQVNIVSKILQQENVSLNVMKNEINACVSFLTKYRDEGFTRAKLAA